MLAHLLRLGVDVPFDPIIIITIARNVGGLKFNGFSMRMWDSQTLYKYIHVRDIGRFLIWCLKRHAAEPPNSRIYRHTFRLMKYLDSMQWGIF